jgi:hypothetical protein
VPRSADPPPTAQGDPPPAKDARDAMAALVCSDLKVEGISIRSYTESIATGDAAVRFAQPLRNNTATTRDFFSCMRAVPSREGS